MSHIKSITIDFVLLFSGWACLVVSLVVSITSGELIWFQRSGSLLVLFSVILEIRQTLATQPLESSFVTINDRPVLMERPISRANKWLHWIARSGIVLGTLVWGYGDLILKEAPCLMHEREASAWAVFVRVG